MTETGAERDLSGQIVASQRRGFKVCLDSGEHLACVAKGRKLELACGDFVSVQRTAPDQGAIAAIQPRRSLLFRADQVRQKLIAANATQVVIVVAPQPLFNPELLWRCLVAAEAAGIQALIVCNKVDVPEFAVAWDALASVRAAGYRCIKISARIDCAPLRQHLSEQLSVLVGQSGMGKSTIINTLIPDAAATTREISTVLNSGKHTTTAATLYSIDASSAIIDTPGLQQFGLSHLEAAQLTQAFPEFRSFTGHCRFRDCAHDREPDCRLQQAVREGAAAAGRLALLRTLIAENAKSKSWR